MYRRVRLAPVVDAEYPPSLAAPMLPRNRGDPAHPAAALRLLIHRWGVRTADGAGRGRLAAVVGPVLLEAGLMIPDAALAAVQVPLDPLPASLVADDADVAWAPALVGLRGVLLGRGAPRGLGGCVGRRVVVSFLVDVEVGQL